ncbi:hypothetical protein GCM10009847_04590 [Leucobacter tardus]|uniref:Uncharacterized protein n=1 Tax=Leucobacter tardus TaxID=501483 RepID=A0A939QBE8_9MICO|nr:hypothetical protein [Leucobacter tardus]MBO2988666.1 hypothetical protein [Leucobacter tardus]
MNTALRRALTSPLASALGVCAFTLIPGRAFPRWTRHGLTWASAGGVAIVVATPGAGEKILGRERADRAGARVQPHPAARLALASLAAALMAGAWMFSWWADEKTERALRKLRLPFPRLWIGIALGATEFWSETQRRAQRTVVGRGNERDG